jgi:hypothetical protein
LSDAVLVRGHASVVADAAEIVRATVPLDNGPADSVKVIQVLDSAPARWGTKFDAGQLAGALAVSADGWIISVGIDTSPEWIHGAGHQLRSGICTCTCT